MSDAVKKPAARLERLQWPVSKERVSELESAETDLSATTTLGERFAIMWQLAQDAWAFRGEPIDESTSPKLVARLIRLTKQ